MALKDRALERYEWHFFTSPVTGRIGPSEALFELLDQNGIEVIFHP